ncbi:lysoplasmalogenase family protein [Pontixanthobacter aestiaquae]|uniref:Lysoplasmalogenase n=2 Tax=Pontixanthobacter aestiaquae TaxID=1509367 RepID=A0A844Z6T5_9SPHN|nr:lysoplasmalogenase family protein [Pontixanthobacter aestiaquae]MDN3645374.1 lysoplasmalogenase family protein [Pontixanthobacter aestiaquae]MXO83625.1 lysoplasmalogenase [Pontixanthobacter aestiaquae]
MPHRALTERRPWLLASFAAAIAYFFVMDSPYGEIWLILLKGAGVAFLAVYALLRHPSSTAKLLALVLALSAMGDMLIELSLQWGGAAFFFSHVAAISLYLANPRASSTPSQKGLAVALLFLTPLICWLLTRDISIASYGLALGGMAATAWMSRFTRYRVGLGAVLFVISDWLIFYGIGERPYAETASMLVWPIYYAAQFLIATGVIQTLRHELRDVA